jgi:hypothetical protein
MFLAPNNIHYWRDLGLLLHGAHLMHELKQLLEEIEGEDVLERLPAAHRYPLDLGGKSKVSAHQWFAGLPFSGAQS